MNYNTLSRYMIRIWQDAPSRFLLPLSYLFGWLIALRRWFYRAGVFKTHHFDVPVIVVGNITVGGTGKTPFVIWLANFLRAQGYSPAIVSRGYGGVRASKSQWVLLDSPVLEVGDEALLLARHAHCPVMVNVDRVAAVEDVLRQTDCNVIISDDGLQHYHLGRAIEVAIVDGVRRFGNQQLLPAGPLREPVSRLQQVDYVIVNEGGDHDVKMKLVADELISLRDNQSFPLTHLTHKTVHAVAGIGHPERFFESLTRLGFDVVPHAFPDHHRFKPSDLIFEQDYPIVMTEKDAVKCEGFEADLWYVRVVTQMDEAFQQQLLLKLESLEAYHESQKQLAEHPSSSTYYVQPSDISSK